MPCNCRKPRRFELHAYGIDPAAQGLGAIAQRSGLRIPATATAAVPDGPSTDPYLFQLVTYTLTENTEVRLVGVKTGVSIGVDTSSGVPPMYPLQMMVRDPNWHFVDGFVEFFVRFVRQRPTRAVSPLVTSGFARRWSDTPALVFEAATFPAAALNAQGTPDYYTSLTTYTAPFGNTMIGESIAGLGAWGDFRFPYDRPAMQTLDPITLKGPGSVVLYGRVRQPPTTHEAIITIPAMMPLPPVLAEEAFVAAYPTAQYWSIFGALTFEEVG